MSSSFPLTRYVCGREDLPYDDQAALLSLPVRRQDYIAHETVMTEGAPNRSFGVVETGLVSNFKVVDCACRQVGFCVRGRIVHLILELAARHDALEMLNDDVFELPFNQGALAGSACLSLVHFNKTFGGFARDGFIARDRSRIRLLDRDKLRSLATFGADYLHLPFRSDVSTSPAVGVDRADHIERISSRDARG